MLQLQFLFELPARLNKCIEMEAYSQAVRYVTFILKSCNKRVVNILRCHDVEWCQIQCYCVTSVILKYLSKLFCFRYYTKARKVLHQYQHMPSFQGIQQDCNVIVAQLSSKLRQQFRDKNVSTDTSISSVHSTETRNNLHCKCKLDIIHTRRQFLQ